MNKLFFPTDIFSCHQILSPPPLKNKKTAGLFKRYPLDSNYGVNKCVHFRNKLFSHALKTL